MAAVAAIRRICEANMDVDTSNTVDVGAKEQAICVCSPSSSCMEDDPQLKMSLAKWGMLSSMQLTSWRYAPNYHKLQGEQLALDMFNDPAFREHFQVTIKGGQQARLSGRVTAVGMEPVPATAVRLDLFDKLLSASPPIVRPSGELVKRMEDMMDGYQVCDELRALLLCEDNEHAGLYSPQERGELLWRLLEHVVLGGACCQFEDTLEPYLEAVKKLYRRLVAVRKQADSGQLRVASHVWRVTHMSIEGGPPLFPCHGRNNFCYLTADPLKHVATVWYHAAIPWW